MANWRFSSIHKTYSHEITEILLKITSYIVCLKKKKKVSIETTFGREVINPQRHETNNLLYLEKVFFSFIKKLFLK